MKEPIKPETKQLFTLAATISLAFLAGIITMSAVRQVGDPIIIEETVLNVIQETEIHYYSNGATLSITAIYHEDGSVDTHTEYSYPMENLDQEDIPFDFDSEELSLEI